MAQRTTRNNHGCHQPRQEDQPLQRFVAPQIESYSQIIKTRWNKVINRHVVFLSDIRKSYGHFDHISEMTSGSFLPLESVPQARTPQVSAQSSGILYVFYPTDNIPTLDAILEIEKSASSDNGDDDDEDESGDIGESDYDMDYSDGDEDDNDDNNSDKDACSSTRDLFDRSHTVKYHHTSLPDTGDSHHQLNNHSSSFSNQAIHTFRFSLPTPPSYLPSHTSTDNACLKVPLLDRALQESKESWPSMPQHFVVLPEGWTADSYISNTEVPFKLFKMCVCGPNDPVELTWNPHILDEQRPHVRDPHQIIDLFAPTLLLSTRMLLTSLHASQDPAGLTSTSSPASPFPDSREAFEHIQKELGLFDVGAVETLLEHMITYLEEVHLPRQDAADSLQLPTSRYPILERSQLSLKDMALLRHYVDLRPSDTPSAYLNFDKNGNDLWVCRHHHRCLDPEFRMNYVKRTIERLGLYHAATGTIDVHLRTPKDLAVLCRIDPIKASRITELRVALNWSPSPAELIQLVSWAKSLHLTTLSMTGKSSGAGPSPASSRFLVATQADTALVRDIIRSSRNQLAAVTINWDSDLDAATLIQEASLEGHSLRLTIKTDRQEVSTVMFESHIGIDRVISDLGDLPLESRRSFLARKVQNLDIGPCPLSTSREHATAWRAELSSIIQENCFLTSLTMKCKAHDFSTILDTLRSILCKLDNPSTFRHSLRFITLMDSQADTAARFDLTPLAHENPAVVDVTVGTIGSTQFSIIQNHGAFIRVLNLLDGAAERSKFFKFFARSKPTHLVSLMLNVTKLSRQSGKDLGQITTLSKSTFKQLTLIGRPKCREALLSLLEAIRCLRRCQIILTRTGPASMKTWINRVRGAAHKSSKVTYVETPEEVRLMVPELSAFGFALLKSAFDRGKHKVMKRKRRSPVILDEGFDSLLMVDTVVDYGADGQFLFHKWSAPGNYFLSY